MKKVTEDFEALRFNTGISQMMVFVNEAYKTDVLPKVFAEGLVKLLSPIAPHLCEELWSYLGHEETLAYEPWPTFDAAKLVDDEIEVVVQVNGKLRGRAKISKEATKDEMEQAAFNLPTVQEHTKDKQIVKVIVVLGKLVNIVVK